MGSEDLIGDDMLVIPLALGRNLPPLGEQANNFAEPKQSPSRAWTPFVQPCRSRTERRQGQHHQSNIVRVSFARSFGASIDPFAKHTRSKQARETKEEGQCRSKHQWKWWWRREPRGKTVERRERDALIVLIDYYCCKW